MRTKWIPSVFLAAFGLCLLPQAGHARADHTYGNQQKQAEVPDYSALRSEVTARISEEKAGTIDMNGPDRLTPLEVRFRDTCVDLKTAPDFFLEVRCNQFLSMIQIERDEIRFLEADPTTLAAQRNRLAREKAELLKENQQLKNEAAQCRSPAVSNVRAKSTIRRGEGVLLPFTDELSGSGSAR